MAWPTPTELIAAAMFGSNSGIFLSSDSDASWTLADAAPSGGGFPTEWNEVGASSDGTQINNEGPLTAR